MSLERISLIEGWVVSSIILVRSWIGHRVDGWSLSCDIIGVSDATSFTFGGDEFFIFI